MNCVIGHPRSGTMLLAEILNAAGKESCRHEYLCKLSSMAVSIPTEYYAGIASEQDVLGLLRHYDFTPTPWVRIDSNWKLTWILPVFLKRYPTARVLHLSRDPRTNVPSCHNLDFYGDLHNQPRFDRRRFWRRYWQNWMPDIHREDWAELAPFERNCAFWTETHRLALASLADHPFTHRLRLEDVRDRTVRAQVLDFFEVDLPRGTQSLRSVRRPANSKLKFKVSVRMHKHDMLPRYDKWTAAQREALRELCGETARTLGYAL